MENYRVKEIIDLFEREHDLDSLLVQSKVEGFRFLERLVNDYKSGTNVFNKQGEALFGVFTEKGVLVAIGGLNGDHFSSDCKVGRLRRFFVEKEYRRDGVGSLLLKAIVQHAQKDFDVLVLHTDTEQGENFYNSYGFTEGDLYPKSTHYLRLK